MFPRLGILMGVALLGATLSAASAHGQALQLPEFKFFTVVTTVSVPDSGGAYAGGVSRHRAGSSTHGVPGGGPLLTNRGIGGSTSAGGVSVRATVIDHRELDEMVLRAAGGPSFDPATAAKIDRLAAGIDRRRADDPAVAESSPIGSLEEIRRRNEAAERARQTEALALLEKGRKAADEGKPGVARIYFNMAARRAEGALADEIAGHLAALQSSTPADKVVARP
jgi:hypothetical protein